MGEGWKRGGARSHVLSAKAGQTIQIKWLQNTGPQTQYLPPQKKEREYRFGAVKVKHLKVQQVGFVRFGNSYKHIYSCRWKDKSI